MGAYVPDNTAMTASRAMIPSSLKEKYAVDFVSFIAIAHIPL